MFFIFSLIFYFLNFHLNNDNFLLTKNDDYDNIVNNQLIDFSDLNADSFFIQEINGKVLAFKNENKPKDIASLTKLLSAFLGYNLFPSDYIFIFDNESVNQEGIVGNFQVGQKITRNNILKASLVASSNDAIYLLAKTYGLNKFVELMNKTVQDWGLKQTVFLDPTGLGKNISTSKEFAQIVIKIFSKNPEIFYFTKFEKIIINGEILWTTNLILHKYYNLIVGAKTGFKEESGENLAMILKFNKSPFIVLVILDSKNRFEDAEKIIKKLKEYYGD